MTAAMLAADPDASRPQWVNPATFWDDLGKMLAANPEVGPADAAMADQARTLLARRAADPAAASLLDRAALGADADLHAAATYVQVGVDAGNGWQRQEGAGVWGTDWFGRAQAAVIYIFVNDYREALYFVRGTDAAGALLDSRHAYTLTFPAGALPPVDRARGGFWSLTMYDKDYFMLPASPNGRTNLGTVQPGRRRARVRRRRRADPPPGPRGAGRRRGPRELAADAGGAVRADPARLRAGRCLRHGVVPQVLAARPRLRPLLRLHRRRDEPVVSRADRGQPLRRAALPIPRTAITSRRTSPTRRSTSSATPSSRSRRSPGTCGTAPAPTMRRTTRPQDYIDKYKGKFDDGYEAYREWVLKRMIERGILPKGTELTPLNPMSEGHLHRRRRRAALELAVGRREEALLAAWPRSTRRSPNIPTCRSAGSSTTSKSPASSTTR